jgi:hypothetical protein
VNDYFVKGGEGEALNKTCHGRRTPPLFSEMCMVIVYLLDPCFPVIARLFVESVLLCPGSSHTSALLLIRTSLISNFSPCCVMRDARIDATCGYLRG